MMNRIREPKGKEELTVNILQAQIASQSIRTNKTTLHPPDTDACLTILYTVSNLSLEMIILLGSHQNDSDIDEWNE